MTQRHSDLNRVKMADVIYDRCRPIILECGDMIHGKLLVDVAAKLVLNIYANFTIG